MEHSSRKLIFLLTKNLLILTIIFVIGFSFYMNYIYSDKFSKEKLDIIKQDELAKASIEIQKTQPYKPIEYVNVPNYLHNYVDCLNKGIDIKKLSGEIQNKIQILNYSFSNTQGAIGFAYEDINTGFSLKYRENTKTFAASTTKGPMALYIYKLADEKKLDLNKKYTYTSNYYADGTGIIKNQPVGSTYTLKELVGNNIMYSDNIAYLMISSLVNKKDVSNYFGQKGAKYLFNSNQKNSLYQMFGEFTPNDGNVYMKELYKYSLSNTQNSKQLVQFFKDATLNNIKEGTKLPTAHKYGWTSNYVNDMALVFHENPYVLSITTTMGNTDWSPFFQLMAKRINEIHSLYWKEVNNSCKGLLS